MNVELRIEGKGKAPTKSHKSDVGWDLYVSEDTFIYPGSTMDVHTSIYINIPVGMYGRITGRSSTLRKHNLMVNEGIIDAGYTGELYICIHNLGTEPFLIKEGMRLAQVIFASVEDVHFINTEKLSVTDRGSKGFGSSGI